MKAIDIATKNHIMMDDMNEICKELGIPLENESQEMSDKEVFLVEKKVQSVKAKLAAIAEKNKEGRKIKLKRKVVVSKEAKTKQPGEPDDHEDQPEADTATVKSHEKIEADIKSKPPVDKAPQQPAKPASDGTDSKPATERPKYDANRPRPQGTVFTRPSAQGQQGSGGYNRPQGQGGQRPQGQGSGGYNRPQGQGGQRPQGQGSGGYNRPQGQGGQRPQGQGSGGYNRPQGQGAGGYNRPQGQGGPRPQGGGSSSDGKPVAALVTDDKKRKKGTVKGKDSKRYKKEQEEKEILLKKKIAEQKRKEISAPGEISITESISVGDLAKKLNIKVNEVISKLMKLGVMATINQVVDSETAAILASEYGTEVKVVSLYDETVIKSKEDNKLEDNITRPPVVTVMGHVDHGKTKLLDAIRKTDVTAGEHGGITQHIGAYTVHVGDKRITFLDTPGHEAFTTMRARGASVTDIVVLVVAANDGVMPQTIEAINHAKAANVPIIVAINKIDLPDSNLQKVKQELSNHGLQPEEWGGQTLFAEISAKHGTNIDGLLDLILIQSEILELKANPKLMAKGTVIESRLDPGRGAVSTILVQNGTLHVGDHFVVGVFNGKVRAMFDELGRAITEAPPSTPIEIFGISGVPGAGDPFEGVESDKFAKQISHKRLELKRQEAAKKVRKVTLESLNEMIKDGEVQDLNIIVKADVDGSAQALTEALEKLSFAEVRVRVIHSGTGGINETDVMLASASNAIIIGYHVRPTGRVSDIADKENVSIKFFNIIFEVTDSIRAAMEGMLSPEMREESSGRGEVKQVFKVSKVGVIAGAICLGGKVERSCKMRLIRDGVVIYDGKLKSLKRYKDDVSSVDAGQEFGFGFDGFNDIKEGDTFEAYKIIEIKKTL